MPCAPVRFVLFMPWAAPRPAAPVVAFPAWALLLGVAAAAALPGAVVGLACGVAGGMTAGGRAAAAAAGVAAGVAAAAAAAAGGRAAAGAGAGILGFGIFGISRAVLNPIISPYM